MTETSKNQMSLDEFAELVDTFGADRTRWPLLRRHRAEALLAIDPFAKQIFDEAAALDTVLEAAVVTPPANLDALLDKIVARATAGPRLATTAVPAPSNNPVTNPAFPKSSRAPSEKRDLWRAGALMAASLVAGLYLGQAQWSASAVPLMQELAATTFGGNTQNFTFAALTTDALDDE